MEQRYYLSGPRDNTAECRTLYAKAANKWRALGFLIHDPYDNVVNDIKSLQARRYNLQNLFKSCGSIGMGAYFDGVFVLPDWETCQDAMLEITIARMFGMRIRDVETGKDLPDETLNKIQTLFISEVIDHGTLQD